MPTYTVYSHHPVLRPKDKRALVHRITLRHSATTGAPVSFVQILFHTLDGDDHYIGGQPADPRSVHVHGQIRAGRSTAAKDALAAGIRDDIVAALGTPEYLVWVYLTEIPPDQMTEFGRPLPPPGQEQQWRDALPEPLHAHLDDLDSRARQEFPGN